MSPNAIMEQSLLHVKVFKHDIHVYPYLIFSNYVKWYASYEEFKNVFTGDKSIWTEARAIILVCRTLGPPGVLGIWGKWLFIFRDLRSTGNYFRGAGEQAHSFGDLGSPAKKQKKKIKEKPPFCLIF